MENIAKGIKKLMVQEQDEEKKKEDMYEKVMDTIKGIPGKIKHFFGRRG